MKKLKSLSLIIALVLAVCCLFACTGAVKKYDVKFETYGFCEVATQQIEENRTATRPVDPSCSTHNFIGWYADEEFSEEFDFSSPITQNTVIYAKWTEKESTYTIKFDNQGKGKKVASQYIEAGVNGKITKPDNLSSRGWKFLGWSLDKNDKVNLIDFETYIPTCSITLYAQWNEIFTVSFDLNNEEALLLAPDGQDVEDGTLASEPTELLPVTGYNFLGWYMQKQGGEAVDFSTTVITSDTVFYAQWEKNAEETIDYDAPYTDNYEEAGFGAKPDLDGFVIDGKMGVDEDWEEQVWYKTATLDEYKVTLSITTKFSEKGLYFFAKIKDDNGINFVDRYYSDRNSNLLLYITAGDNSVFSNALVRSYRIDSDSLYPCDEYVKVAPYVIGQVNSQESATLCVEAFLLWEELQLEVVPQTVKINPVYNYKTKGTTGNLLNAQTGITMSSVSSKNLDEYAVFDKNGHVKNSVKSEILGDSDSGVVMSEGWDTEYVNAENDAYVSPKTDTKKAIFFKNINEENYSAQVIVNPESCESNGKAGILLYHGALDYSAITVTLNDSTYDKTDKKFTKYQISHISNAKNVLTNSIIHEESADSENVSLNVLYVNGCLYVKVNGETVSAFFVNELKGKNTVVGLYSEGCKGVKLTDYSVNAYTSEQGETEAKNYAYLLSVGRTRNLTIKLDKEWISSSADDKNLTLTLSAPALTLTTTQRNKIRQSGVVGSGVRMYCIENLLLDVDGVSNDITALLTDPVSGVKNGKLLLNYNFDGNGTFSNTSRQMQESELVAVVFTLKDMESKAVANVTTDNPFLSAYTVNVDKGDGVIVLPKGYNCEITVTTEGMGSYSFTVDKTVTDTLSFGEIVLA